MIRILIASEQSSMRQEIKSLLNKDPDFKAIAIVRDGRSAVKQVDLLSPDIVLLELEMPVMNGITAAKYINHLYPDTKVIILSSREEPKYVVQSLVAGAKAYILQHSLRTDLKQMIIAVNSGYSQIESRLLTKASALEGRRRCATRADGRRFSRPFPFYLFGFKAPARIFDLAVYVHWCV